MEFHLWKEEAKGESTAGLEMDQQLGPMPPQSIIHPPPNLSHHALQFFPCKKTLIDKGSKKISRI